jgi:hypothetical protein
MWLGVEHIGEKEVSHILDMVGSGQSVGGVVSETVGPSNDPDNTPIQVRVLNNDQDNYNKITLKK